MGAVGLTIRRFGIPVLPLILGVILGPLMEVKLREALDLSGGDISGLFNEGLAIFVYVLVALAIVIPIVLGRLRPGVPTDPDEGGGPSDDRRRGLHPGPVRRGRAGRRHRGGRRRQTDLVVVNATKGDALVDRRYVGDAGLAALNERLDALDLPTDYAR